MTVQGVSPSPASLANGCLVLGAKKLATYYVKSGSSSKNNTLKKSPAQKPKNLIKAPVMHTFCVLRVGTKRVRSSNDKGENPSWDIEKLEVYVSELQQS